MRRARMQSLASVIAASVAFACLGCERKAPGPEECARFAETVVRAATGGPIVSPTQQAQVDEETRQCLTRPYDRALLACVETTARAHACLERYRQRTGQSE